MDYTLEQFKAEARRCPVVMKVDGFMVPVDVTIFIAACRISGVHILAITMVPQEYKDAGTHVLILTGITWEPLDTQTFHLK